MATNRKTKHQFEEIQLRIASPERILEWSHGEVTKPETMNYRTQRSEKNGLFDERIFGPEKDYECYCGKYKGIRYKGITCEKCGVEVTRAIVRRERMGHIELATPVAHIWFLRSIPSRIGLILDMNTADLEKVVYFAGYLITKVDEDERKKILKDLESEYKSKVKSSQDKKTKEALKDLFTETKKEIDIIQQGKVLDEVDFHKYSMKYGTLFEAKIGAEAIHDIFKELDLNALLEQLQKDLETAGSLAKEKLNKRIALVSSMIRSKTRPEWMFMTRIPVIPPALRPMVALDGGRHATSDLNDLYRRVINRNNRLKKLQGIQAPDVILRNEKRILQEAVDALIDNSMRHGNQMMAGSAAQKRPLKSLADNLKGKRGLFRSNLLGKRVDYSGRSVIVVGPKLRLNQCGLPKHMALELFRPFVISGLLRRELAFNIRGANRLIDEQLPEVWEVLEEVIKGKYVFLNRAPTLHRLGIQAFQPVLIEGNAIQVHPLVCTAFNADFDGDQMAVHVPLSAAAQFEAREIMAADKNVLKPGSGDPVVASKLLDIVLGCFWITKMVEGKKGEGQYFPGPNMALTAVDFGQIDYRAKINVKGKKDTKFEEFLGTTIETTAGRILFNKVLPEDYPFINEEIDKKKMQKIVDDLIVKYGIDELPRTLDRIKQFGFKFATLSGTTWGIDDIQEPKEKKEIVENALAKVKEVNRQFDEGLLSESEKLREVVEIWQKAKNDVEEKIPDTLDTQGSVYDMWKSGARGSLGQITNMAAMKGLIVNTQGESIEFPVLSSGKEGLTPIEYFITTYGSRKGLTDTALNTAKAGYLTRRLFDVAQDVVISEKDCGTKKHVVIKEETASGLTIPLKNKIRGRVLAKDIKGTDGKTLFKKNHLVTKQDAQAIADADIHEVAVRSPLTCESKEGICQECYGMDLGSNELIDLGEAVGTVAAQAIGEPGTQLTMRTFHSGGTASVGGDITAGLPRVEEVFERRKPKTPAVIARVDGTITAVEENGKERRIEIAPEGGSKKKAKKETEYVFSVVRMPLVKVGDKVEKGQLITDGSADISELFKYAGEEAAQNYIISQVNKIYELQGESVARKHIEVIIRQMFSRVKVVDAGDSDFSNGTVVERYYAEQINEKLENKGKTPAKLQHMVAGISEVALSRISFLSSASFQHTTKVLIGHAIRGAKEVLRGLKENVILGRLIPAGTGYVGSQKNKMAQKIEKEEQEEAEAVMAASEAMEAQRGEE